MKILAIESSCDETAAAIVEDGRIVFNENWEADELKEKEDAFNKAFFETTLGYIRREVTMLDGTSVEENIKALQDELGTTKSTLQANITELREVL